MTRMQSDPEVGPTPDAGSALSVDPEAIDTLVTTLNDTATEVKTPVHEVKPGWFGASFTGGVRLATNTDMAHAVEQQESDAKRQG